MKETLESVSTTLDGLENQLKGVTGETTMLLHKTNALADDIQVKVEKLDTVVDAVKGVGTAVQGVGDTVVDLNTSLQRVTKTVSSTVEKNEDKIAQALQWGAVAKEIKDKWFTKKKAKQNEEAKSEVMIHTQQLEGGRG